MMVDEIDKESTREELYSVIDSLRRRLRVYRSVLSGSPKMPDPVALREIGRHAKFPEDHARGKEIQREIGEDRIPYKTECEGGAGLWDRITSGSWRTSE